MATQEHIEFVRANHLTMSAKEMGRRLGHTHGYVYAIKAKYSIHTPPEIISGFLKNSHYKKGNIPANKGIPMSAWMAPENIEKIKQHLFKPGILPWNTKKEGTISLRKNTRKREKYYYICTGLDQWMPLHRYTWIKAHGPIPPKMTIQFKDQNTLNCSQENLYMISRAEHAQICRAGGNKLTFEEKQTIIIAYKLMKKVQIHEKQNYRSEQSSFCTA